MHSLIPSPPPPPGTPHAAKRTGARFTAAQVEAALALKPHLRRATDQETRNAIDLSEKCAFEPQRPRLESPHLHRAVLDKRQPHRSRVPSALRSVMPLGVHPDHRARRPLSCPRTYPHPPPRTPRAAKRVGARFTAAQVEAALALKPHLQRATDQQTRKALDMSEKGAFEPQRPRRETQHVPTASPHHRPRVALTPYREHVSSAPTALTHLAPSAFSVPHIIPKTHSTHPWTGARGNHAAKGGNSNPRAGPIAANAPRIWHTCKRCLATFATKPTTTNPNHTIHGVYCGLCVGGKNCTGCADS